MIKQLFDKVRESTVNLEITKDYNIFRSLHLNNDETRLHSRLIADLLNPYGQHEEGDKYLISFLKYCIKQKLSDLDIDNIRVKTEYRIPEKGSDTGSGRIDILVVSSYYVIAIENKINAMDQKNQLLRYSNYLKRLEADEKKKTILLYLSPSGKDATMKSKQQLISNVDYHIISYRNEIKYWIENCIAETTNERLKTILQQYLEIINRLTRGVIVVDKVIELLFPDDKTVNLPELKTLIEIMSHGEEIELSIIKRIITLIENQVKDVFELKELEQEPKDSSYIKSYRISENYGIRFKYTHKILFYGACILINKEHSYIDKKLEKEGFIGQSNHFLGKKQTKISLSSNKIFPEDLFKEILEISNGVKLLNEILTSEK